MPDKKIILANLKAYRSPPQVEQWCHDFLSALRAVPQGIELVLAVPAMAMERAADAIKGRTGVSLAAQALSSFPQGSYTGSTPAAWLRGLVRYSLAGHRERRLYFHEGVQDVARQVREALEEDIRPIVCVDGDTFTQQLAAFSPEQRENLYWACTPKVPVALRLPEDLAVIRGAIGKILEQGGRTPVLYGGGVTAGTIGALWALPELSGIMVGEACRDARTFADLIGRLD